MSFKSGLFSSSIALLSSSPLVCLANASSPTVAPEPAATAAPAAAPLESEAPVSSDLTGTEDIDGRFALEGYAGAYAALFQHTLPTIGITGSMYLDDDFLVGADFGFSRSKPLYGDFSGRSASLWNSMEMVDGIWMKSGVSYVRLDKPSAQDPISVLSKGTDKKLAQVAERSDSLGLDLSVGQLWTLSDISIAVDYFGFTIPFLRLTGPKLPLFSLHAARVDVLYNIE